MLSVARGYGKEIRERERAVMGEAEERENRKIERERGNSGRVRARERGREGQSEERKASEIMTEGKREGDEAET